jgi:hypothetical protein
LELDGGSTSKPATGQEKTGSYIVKSSKRISGSVILKFVSFAFLGSQGSVWERAVKGGFAGASVREKAFLTAFLAVRP